MSKKADQVCVPCKSNKKLQEQIEVFAEALKTESHKLGTHGLSESEFYASGLLRGAVERIRGQNSADLKEKRDFVSRVLNWLQDNEHIQDWKSEGENNRHEYLVTLQSGKLAGIEIKGCLDGANTVIFERPEGVDEFIIWSVCTNPGADPRKNVWSGIHTRLSAHVITEEARIDGLIVWDWACNTLARPCPKLTGQREQVTLLGPFRLPSPCIYLLPGAVPALGRNAAPAPLKLEEVEILQAFHKAFGGSAQSVNAVSWQVSQAGSATLRSTTIVRDETTVAKSDGATRIRRK